MFRYEASQPVDCKFLDLSGVNVSSSVMDIIIFLYTVLTHQHINNCHLSYLLTYHSHLTQLCHQFDISEYVSLEELLQDFQDKKIYGSILNCKLQMGSYLLNSEEIIDISKEKSELFLKYLEDCCDCCDCSEQRSPGISCHRNVTTTSSQHSISNKIATFIRQSTVSQSARDIWSE